MVYAANLGYPRIGLRRELKTALEKLWNAQISEDDLRAVGSELRLANWRVQSDAGMDFIPSNDFSFYDHVLDTIAMVGAVPKRFGWTGGNVDLKTYFLMARGQTQKAAPNPANGQFKETQAMEMTKWFNTNYHFIVPELEDGMRFALSSTKCVDEFTEAERAGIHTRPVLLGPVSFLYLAKGHTFGTDEDRLGNLLDVYEQLLRRLAEAGADWVQIDEPCLSCDLNGRAAAAFAQSYERLSKVGLSIMLTTYFAPIGSNLRLAFELPVQGLHLDLINGRGDLDVVLAELPDEMLFSAGVIDGHNVWRNDLARTARWLEDIAEKIGPERLIVAPSCSLLHVPLDVNQESKLDAELKSWLAFAQQKVEEISILTDALTVGWNDVQSAMEANKAIIDSACSSKRRHNQAVENRVKQVSPEMSKRSSPFATRAKTQQAILSLPLLPTTTIGSFPQTKEIRTARQQLKSGKLTAAQYEKLMENEIKSNVAIQEELGLDVFVHGEPERTDMVEYFAEMLEGMAVTQHGWVQSYGSRCVRAPIIYGSVSRPSPMTTKWAEFAQKQTTKPVKGMLTGPVTILQWSFVRDDQPRETTCMELALAIRDEVVDLESAGIGIIQIDEPAIREGLPLKRSEWEDYLRWSVRCFQVASTGVQDGTQIHTHMCYSEFGDMVDAIAAMDADVISIEASRSKMDLLDAIQQVGYPNAIGPGVYDIHSPRVPTQDEMTLLLEKALRVIPAERLWVNPDCGLKTRTWDEVVPALRALVLSAFNLRSKISHGSASAISPAQRTAR